MYYHEKFKEAFTLVDNDIPIMLVGESGTGKTTLIDQIAEKLNLELFCISMTRQTTLSSLIGFKNLNHDYQPTELRRAVEHGGLLLLDEINAADANVLLCLNTLENGFMSFPDGVIKKHPKFRLCATANPEGKNYTGRSKLDASTLDRFDVINLPIDPKLQENIVGADIVDILGDAKNVLEKYSVSRYVSMRDAIKYKKRKKIGMLNGFIENLLMNTEALIEEFNQIREAKTFVTQDKCKSLEYLISNVKKSQGIYNEKTT